MKRMSFLILFLLLIGSISPVFSADKKQSPTGQTNTNSVDKYKNIEPINLRFLNDGNYRLSWKIIDKNIEISISAKTTGWVAIGFEPSVGMKDADIYLGYVDQKGKGQSFDMYSTGEIGPHPFDTDLGGKNDIISPVVMVINGWTTFSFQRKLDTGDRFDKPILLDKPIKVLWSFGSTKDTTTYHAVRGLVTIDFSKPTVSIPQIETDKETKQNQPNPLLKKQDIQTVLKFHIFFMIFGFLLLLTTLSMVFSFKKKTWWFKCHRIIGFLSFAFITTAFCFALKLVDLIGKGHFNIFHGVVGLITFEITIVLMVASFLYLKVKNNHNVFLLKKLRTVHIWIARILIVLFISNAFFGIRMAQLFLNK